MEQTKTSIKEHATLWLSKGYDNARIKTELLNIGIDERNVPEMLKEIGKLRNTRKTTMGLMFILAGALLCLISCIMTIMSDTTGTGFTLYGLTSIGIIIAFAGLVRIFN